MDCQTALEFLECVRPDSDDLDLPELAEAHAHLNVCDDCQAEFAQMQHFDRLVNDAVETVAVPEWLHASLLTGAVAELLSTTESDVIQDGEQHHESGGVQPADKSSADAEPLSGSTAVAEEATAPLSRSRRRLRLLVSMVAVCGLLLTMSVWWQAQPKSFTTADLLQTLPVTLSGMDPFDQSFGARPPLSWDEHRYLRVADRWQGLSVDDRPGHEIAVALFRFSPPRSAPVTGLVAAIPASRVNPLPSSTSFSQAAVGYARKGTAAVAWQEGGIVYLCLLNGNASQLEQIQRSLSGTAA